MADATKKSLLSRFGSGLKKAGKMAMDAYLNPDSPNPAGSATKEAAGGLVAGSVRNVLRKAMKRGPRSFDNPKAAPAKRATGSRFVRTDA